MNSTLSRKALFALAIAIGFAIPVMSMNVPRDVYSKAQGNDIALLTNLINDIGNYKIPHDQIITRISQAPQLLKLRLPHSSETLLTAAASSGRFPVTETIINIGATEGVNGDAAVNHALVGTLDTPLSLAAKKGHSRIVKYLLDMGPTRANLQKALEEAQQADQPVIAQLLQEKIAPMQSATQPATRPEQQLTEEEQLARAIAESLKAQQPATQPGQQPAPQLEVGKIPYALRPSEVQEFITSPRRADITRGFQIRNQRGFDEAGAAPALSLPQLQDPYKQVEADSQNDRDLSGLIGRIINGQPIDQIISKPEKKWMMTARNSRGQTLLEVAIEKNNDQLVAQLLSLGAKAPLLAQAIQRNNVALVAKLLQLGANPNYAIDAEGMTPLMQAVKTGNKALVEALINGKARVNLYAKDNRTALSLAVFGNRAEIAQVLSNAGGRMFLTMIIAFNPPDHFKFLYTAYTDLTKCVGAQINSMPRVTLSEAHLSVLYFSFFIPYGDEATFQGQVQRILDTVTRQVENFNLKRELVLLTNNNPFTGPRLNSIGKQHIAINYRSPNNYQTVTDFLFMQIVNALNIPTLRTYGEQQNPHISIARNQGAAFTGNWDRCALTGIVAQPLGCLDFIKGSYGLNMRFPRNGALTTEAPSLMQSNALKGLLHLAILNDNGASELAASALFVKLLLDNGADVNDQDENGNTPLHVAAMRSSPEKIIALLLDPTHQAKIDVQNKDGYTPLHFAIMNNNGPLVQLLLNKKANTNLQNKDGNTPLHLAVKNKATALVNLLLNAGADKKIANKAGDKALDLAQKQGDDAMADIILKFKGLHVELKNDKPLLLAHLNLATQFA